MKNKVQKVFQEYKMIAVVQNNACNAEDMIILKHRLHKYGMLVKLFPNQVQQNILAFLLLVLVGIYYFSFIGDAVVLERH